MLPAALEETFPLDHTAELPALVRHLEQLPAAARRRRTARALRLALEHIAWLYAQQAQTKVRASGPTTGLEHTRGTCDRCRGTGLNHAFQMCRYCGGTGRG